MALQTLEFVYNIDPKNKQNQTLYEKIKTETTKILNLNAIQHHHVKKPYVILVGISQYNL